MLRWTYTLNFVFSKFTPNISRYNLFLFQIINTIQILIK